MGTTRSAATAAVRRRGISGWVKRSGVGRGGRTAALDDALLWTWTLASSTRRRRCRLGRRMACCVEHASPLDARFAVPCIEHRIDVGRAGRTRRARARDGQHAAVSRVASRRVGRIHASDDDHHRQHRTTDGSLQQAFNRPGHERHSSRDLPHCIRVRFVDNSVNK